MTPEDKERDILRHTVAAVAYRGAKVLRNAPQSFGEFRIGETTKTPLEILAYLGDLFDWALSLVKGEERWNNPNPLKWDEEVDPFNHSLKRFDEYLNSNAPFHVSTERLFQGPVADALTHIGQLAVLRRLSASPIKGENYFNADIQPGCFGLDQPDPAYEFD